MRGYTIDKSIELLEKDVKMLKQSGAGGTSAELVTYNNQDTSLRSVTVQDALTELDDNVSSNVGMIEQLQLDVVNSELDIEELKQSLSQLTTFVSDEIEVGTYIGKKRYRRVVEYSALESGTKFSGITIPNLDLLVSVDGIAKDSTSVQLPIPYFNATNNYCTLFVTNSNQLYYVGQGSFVTNSIHRVTIEYTKK